MQPKKGTGEKTSTHRIDGQTYQMRRLTCGNREHCNVCKEQGGHAAVYLDNGANAKPRWTYYGSKLPQADPDYQPAKCQRDGCENLVPPSARRGAKYCSNACRQAAHRAKSDE